MEQWEIDLRAKLNAELKEGSYDIDNCLTGKQGYIDFHVEMVRQVKAIKFDVITPNYGKRR